MELEGTTSAKNGAGGVGRPEERTRADWDSQEEAEGIDDVLTKY